MIYYQYGMPGGFCVEQNPRLTSLILLRITFTCALKPGRVMSHNWLHTPDSRLLNEKGKKWLENAISNNQ